jgi:hypothetical protein
MVLPARVMADRLAIGPMCDFYLAHFRPLTFSPCRRHMLRAQRSNRRYERAFRRPEILDRHKPEISNRR